MGTKSITPVVHGEVLKAMANKEAAEGAQVDAGKSLAKDSFIRLSVNLQRYAGLFDLSTSEIATDRTLIAGPCDTDCDDVGKCDVDGSCDVDSGCDCDGHDSCDSDCDDVVGYDVDRA